MCNHVCLCTIEMIFVSSVVCRIHYTYIYTLTAPRSGLDAGDCAMHSRCGNSIYPNFYKIYLNIYLHPLHSFMNRIAPNQTWNDEEKKSNTFTEKPHCIFAHCYKLKHRLHCRLYLNGVLLMYRKTEYNQKWTFVGICIYIRLHSDRIWPLIGIGDRTHLDQYIH